MEDDHALLASALGILRCLRLLSDEAATLRLHCAVFAIREAMEAVAVEGGADAFSPFAETLDTSAPIVFH